MPAPSSPAPPLTWRAKLRARVGDRVQSTLRRVGYELHPADDGPALTEDDRRRARLFAHLGVTLLLDVGANDGGYAQRARLAGYEGRIVSFEPLADAFAVLERRARDDAGWTARHLALGAEAGPAEINVAGNSSSSSLLGMGERHLESAPESRYVGVQAVEVATLAELLPELAQPRDVIYLKLDVQGYEMAVLRGAEPVLDRIAAVQAEMSLVPLYDGASGWRELVDWLEERGFRLAGLESGHDDQRTGEVLQADGIFVRRL